MEGSTFFFPWEVRLMEWLQGSIPKGGISFISFFSAFGEELFLIIILGLLYWGLDKRIGKTIGLLFIMGVIWCGEVKNVFLRRRPYFDHEGIACLRSVKAGADPLDIAAQGYSFPSCHAANVSSVYGGLAILAKKGWMGIAAVVLTIMVSLSRVVVGVHYPTDVLVGLLMGVIIMVVIFWMEKHVKNQVVFYGILLLTCLPGFFYCKSEDFFTGVGILVGFIIGFWFDEKYVHFPNTKNVLCILLRVLGGAAIYFALGQLLKMPFSKEFLGSGTLAAQLVRTIRYVIIGAVDFGIYPMCFGKVFRKAGTQA